MMVDWSDVATSLGMLGQPPEQGEGRKDSSLESQAGAGASLLDTFVSVICPQNCRRINAYCCKPSSLW